MPRARRDQKGFSPRGFRAGPHGLLDFRVPASTPVRQYISAALNPPVKGILLQQPGETNTKDIWAEGIARIKALRPAVCWNSGGTAKQTVCPRQVQVRGTKRRR